MDPSKPANNWDNKWGQTADLVVPTGDNVCYVINDGSWDAGYWTVYPPVGGGSDQGGSGNQGGSGDQGGDSGDQGGTVTACRLIIKVNKSINWYDKYLYVWENNTPTLGAWPGTKTNWDKEEGNYYVYYYDLPASYNGKTINYIVNCGSGGSGNQTADLQVTITGAETVVVIDDCTTSRTGEKQVNGVMLRPDDPDMEAKKADCFRRASYLAKTNTKGNAPKGQREMFSSRIPKEK